MDMPARQYLFGSFFLLANRLQAIGDTFLPRITMKQWLLLVMISTFGATKPSVSEVAALTGSSRQNVRKMLEVLQNSGFVQLHENERDRRNLCVVLTPQTHQFFEEFDAQGDAFLDALFLGVNDTQMETGRQLFEALFQNMERMEENYEKNGSYL